MLENLEIFFRTLRSTNTFQNCDIYEGRRLIPRHLSAPSSVFETLPLSTQVCLNIVNCFTDATRGLKAKKAPTNSLFVGTYSSLQLTREQSRVRFTDEVVSSMKNDSKRDRFIVGFSFLLLAFGKKERKRRRKKVKKGINANESILWERWNVSSHISEMMIIHRNNSRSVALKVIPRNWVS